MRLTNLSKINIFRTVYFNFKYFPLQTAILFPICIGYGVKFTNLGGKIRLSVKPSFGLVFLGYSSLDFNGLWVINGRVRFKGGTDSLIFVGKDGILETGVDFLVNGSVAINCVKSIKFGDYCLLAHKIEIWDTDFHSIYNMQDMRINPDRPVIIGDRVWIGSHTLILKGTTIASHCVIGAGSILTKNYLQEFSIYAGCPATLVKEGVKWDY
jgi:acetyltransferase-like isoleucine patch superfamily enzyme